MANPALRQLVSERRAAVVPGVYSALVARQVELAGFEAVYVSGAGIANSLLALPDLGLTSFKEVLDQVQYIVDAVRLPVIVDADTGFGNALSVRRVVRALERAGASAVQLEDQEFPKRCGHFDGTRVIETDEMLGKIRAAVDSRTDDNLLIVARTDAREGLGLQAAIERAARFAEAGADMIFVEAPRSLAEFAEVGRCVGAPCMANVVEGGKGVAPTQAELAGMGFAIALHANIALRASMLATTRILDWLAAHGTAEGAEEHFATWEERQRLVRLDEYQLLEERYARTVGGFNTSDAR